MNRDLAVTPRYDLVSRFFHWSMAIAILWQCLTVLARVLAEDSPLDNFFWPTHKPLGLVLMLLVTARIAWAVLNRYRRPEALSRLAGYGHMALYGLMAVVPLLALMRQYGSGRTFEAFGITVMTGFEGNKIEWMMAPGSLLHGSLGWTLFAFIIGHILMAFVHRRQGNSNVFRRMW